MLWGDEAWPQEIGALAVLDGRPLLDADGRFRIDAMRETIGSRLHLVPRFRQCLRVPRRGLGGPVWVDASAFDVADHVRVVPLPDPAGEAELLSAAERLRAQRLDRSRPLWGMWFLTGLAGGRVGLFVKTHHVVADGAAAVGLLGTLLDPGPEAVAPAAPPRRLPPMSRTLPTPESTRARWRGLRKLLDEPPGTPTSLDRRVGPDRALALIRTDLDAVKEAAHAHDAKVNDVLLTAVAAGVGGLLSDRGEPIDGVSVRVAVPVSLRPRGEATEGNLVGQMIVPVPIGPMDPALRLRRIAADTAGRKATPPPAVGRVLRTRLARRMLLAALDRQRLNVTTANVPGTPSPLFLAGARVLEVFPVLPLIWKVSLGVGALSYAGRFGVGIVADRAAHPDLDVFTAGMRAELQALGVPADHPSLAEEARP